MTADELKTWMIDNGYSVRGLARALALSPTTVQSYRSGKYRMPLTFVFALDTLAFRRRVSV